MLSCIHHKSLLVLALSLFLLSACAPSRSTSSSFIEVRDTTRVLVHDTVHVTLVHDSIVFRASAHTHEEETVTYDSQTGNPIQSQKTRDTDIDIDALVRHIADSLYAIHNSDAMDAHNEDSSSAHEEAVGEPALSPLQQFARKVASLACICFVGFFVYIAIRIFLRRKGSSCW